MTMPYLSRLRPWAPPPLLLMAMVSALAAAFFFSERPVGQVRESSGSEEAPSDGPASAGTAGSVLVADDAEIADEVIARPLLAPSRRPVGASQVASEQMAPAPVVTDEKPEVAAPQPVVVMKGYVWDGRAAQALLLWGEGNPAEWYSLGAAKDGWTISRITSLSVTLSSGASDFTINLY